MFLLCVVSKFPDYRATSKYKHKQQIIAFKRYAQEFVNAAMKPLLTDRRTVEGACECIPIVEQEVGDHPTYAKLAIMSMVRDYYKDFQIVRKTSESNLSSIMPIKNGLMINIRAILVTLGRPIDDYTPIQMGDVIRTYLSKTKRDPEVKTRGYNVSEESALRCYRTMYSLRSKRFSQLLSTGFEFVSKLLVAYDKGLDGEPIAQEWWAELGKIIGKISKCELSTVPDPDDADEAVEKLRASLDGNETDSDVDTESESETDSDLDSE